MSGKYLHKAALFLPLSLVFMSALCCRQEPDIKPIKDEQPAIVSPDSLAGELKLQFDHTVDGVPLAFETHQYVNPAGDHYKVVDLQYYISNLKLKSSSTGKTFAFPNSYYLIRPKVNKTGLTLKGIPLKDYDQVEFSVGVDPEANATNAHSGDLDPAVANDMTWPWDTGYKFLLFTGYHVTPNASQTIQGLDFHIGENKNYKTMTFPLSQVLHFGKNKPCTIEVGVNLNELFRNPNPIDFDVVYSVADHNPDADKMAENYANGMFTIVQ
jgi:hypothetical protein